MGEIRNILVFIFMENCRLSTLYATFTYILCINKRPDMNRALIAVAFKCENAKLKLFLKT